MIPTDDYTLILLSKNKNLLSNHYVVAVEDWELLKTIVEKWQTYEITRPLGISSPETILIDSLKDLEYVSKDLKYPCLIKPLESHKFFDRFKRKVFTIQNKKELMEKGAVLQKMELKMMVQEIIPGPDGSGVNYNSYFVNGNPVAEFTAQKIRIDPPFFGSPRVLVSKHIPEIIGMGRSILRRLGVNGFSCMEFKKDARDGMFKLMEINCRNNLTGSLAVNCGINFPWIQYRHLMLGKVDPLNNCHFKENIYWIDLIKDVKRFVVSQKEEGYTLKEYAEPYLGEKVFSDLSLNDPLPFLYRCYTIARKQLRDCVSPGAKILNILLMLEYENTLYY
jgi:predicted ATP-grasp superfamily ATP-dependent carboligase